MRHGISAYFSHMLSHVWTRQFRDERVFLSPVSNQSASDSSNRSDEVFEPDDASADEVVQHMAILLERLKEGDRELLLSMAEKMVKEKEDERNRELKKHAAKKPSPAVSRREEV